MSPVFKEYSIFLFVYLLAKEISILLSNFSIYRYLLFDFIGTPLIIIIFIIYRKKRIIEALNSISKKKKVFLLASGIVFLFSGFILKYLFLFFDTSIIFLTQAQGWDAFGVTSMIFIPFVFIGFIFSLPFKLIEVVIALIDKGSVAILKYSSFSLYTNQFSLDFFFNGIFWGFVFLSIREYLKGRKNPNINNPVLNNSILTTNPDSNIISSQAEKSLPPLQNKIHNLQIKAIIITS